MILLPEKGILIGNPDSPRGTPHVCQDLSLMPKHVYFVILFYQLTNDFRVTCQRVGLQLFGQCQITVPQLWLQR